MPVWLTALGPLIQVHWFTAVFAGFPGSVVAERVNCHKSPSEPFPVVSNPSPPKSQRLPWTSLQAAGIHRAPGTLVAAAMP